MRESRLLAPLAAGGEFTQPRGPLYMTYIGLRYRRYFAGQPDLACSSDHVHDPGLGSDDGGVCGVETNMNQGVEIWRLHTVQIQIPDMI